MSKANSNTTTTTLAIELTRRSTVGALLASVALISPASAVCNDDPIFMLIEEHRVARAAFYASLRVLGDVEDRAPFRKRPRVQIAVTKEMSITVDGETTVIPARPAYAFERADIDKYVTDNLSSLAPGDAAGLRALYQKRDELLADWDRQEAHAANPELDAAKSAEAATSEADTAATVAMLTTPPTTVAGAVALLRYMEETDTDGEAYHGVDCGEVGDGLSALIASLLATFAPMVQP